MIFNKLNITGFNKAFRSTKWGKERFEDDLSFFYPIRERKAMLEYGRFIGVTEIFEHYGGGVKTDRDDLVVDLKRDNLEKKMKTAFSNEFDSQFKTKYNITNSSSYKFADKLKQQTFDENAINTVQYRPFDERFIYYKQGFTSRPAFDQMKHMLKGDNAGLVFRRTSENPNGWFNVMISNNLVDINSLEAQTYLAPLYLYE